MTAFPLILLRGDTLRSRSNTWISIINSGEYDVESVAVISGTEYTAITAPIIRRSLLSGSSLSVGNCVAGTLTFTVMTTDTIEKSAEVSIKYRIKNASLISEWMTSGPYWVNKRTVNDDLVTFECYDAMLKGNQPYIDNDTTLNWPKPMLTVVQRCAQQMGLTIDARTVIKTGEDYKVPMPDSGTTLLTILGNIAAVHGANWVVTDDNKLRMINVVTAPTGQTDLGNDAVNVPVVIDELLTGKPLQVTRVTMELDSTVGYTAGNSNGYELLISNNPYVSQALCDALYAEVAGITYVPYSVKNASYDPAAELGDYFIVGEVFSSILFEETRRLDVVFSADATAPWEDEVDNEYAYYGEIDRLRDDNERIYKYAQNVGLTLDSKIEQTRTSIELSVAQTYTPKADTITGEVMYYYKSTSPTQLIGGSWSIDPVEWQENYYTWVKIRYIKGDGTYTESAPVCASGSPGLAGAPGRDGTSSYFHIKYSDTPNPQYPSDMTETPSLYIGTYVDNLAGDSTNPADYTWSRFQGLDGENGLPGKDGQDGTTSYLHIKYSNDGGATFTGNSGEDVGIYIGTLVDEIQMDRLDPTLYTWARFQGVDGANGRDGKDGKDGTSVNILGSYDSYEELIAAHPTGNPGDSYLVDGDLYVWSDTQEDWVNVGNIQGPAGESARYLYITSDSATATSRETTAYANLTACVGQGESPDIDPEGTIFQYAWYMSADGMPEYYFGSGKVIAITIDEVLCDERASIRFALVDEEFYKLVDENGNYITDENGVVLGVE